MMFCTSLLLKQIRGCVVRGTSVLSIVNNAERSLHTHIIKNTFVKPISSILIGHTLYPRTICQNFVRTQYNRPIRPTEGPNKSAPYYVAAVVIAMLGMGYAGVPLYRIFCQATGLGGQAVRDENSQKIVSMKPVKERVLTVIFNADTAASLRWNFKPLQSEVKVTPGETALAFYTAKNPTDKPIVGISTYNVQPYDAGQYFNKIQCFCFEEQRLNPHEQVDMPVFFYIDPEYAEDPALDKDDVITLSYTFFEAKEGMNLPLPGFMQR